VVGADDRDMRIAVEAIASYGEGLVVVIIGSLEPSIAGPMSDRA